MSILESCHTALVISCIQGERQIPYDIWELSRNDFSFTSRSKINESLTILLVTKGLLLWSETLTTGWEQARIAQQGSSSGATDLALFNAQKATDMAEGEGMLRAAKEAQAGERIF